MAVVYNSTTSHHTRSTGAFGTSGTVTATMWVKLTTDRNAAFVIWGQRDAGGNFIYLQNAFDDGTTLFLNANASGVIGPSMTVGTWYFVALSRNGTGTNASALHTATPGSAITTVTGTITDTSFTPDLEMFGNNTNNTAWWFSGSLAAFKQWDAALTLGEIEHERLYYMPQRRANLAAVRPFLTGSNTTHALTDYSGNGRTLTAGAASTTADGPPIVWGPRARRYFIPAVQVAVSQLSPLVRIPQRMRRGLGR